MDKKEGRKDDQTKLPLHLLPFDTLYGVSAVLEFGARKYDDRNWELGMAWHRVFRATLNHLWAWWQGEELDPESGLPHLDHALCSLMFLATYSRRKIGEDDRPKV
jgi:hypothetical protein